MNNVCHGCGEYREDQRLDLSGTRAICPSCGHEHPVLRLPLFCLTGPSGCGKTSVCLALLQQTQEFVVMESDILWRKEFDSPESDWHEYRNLWLRVCKNISQSGRSVLLCGSTSPGQFESCAESRFFSSIHYLALLCDDDVLASRLRRRPSWRQCGAETFTNTHQQWCRWFRETKHEQDVTLLDTSRTSIESTAMQVLGWAKGRQSVSTGHAAKQADQASGQTP